MSPLKLQDSPAFQQAIGARQPLRAVPATWCVEKIASNSLTGQVFFPLLKTFGGFHHPFALVWNHHQGPTCRLSRAA